MFIPPPLFCAEFPVKAPAHNVNLVYTRNVIGPMDYTPVGFTDMDHPHLTTYGHELGLSVVFQSGIQQARVADHRVFLIPVVLPGIHGR